jgi:hypothetical protein
MEGTSSVKLGPHRLSFFTAPPTADGTLLFGCPEPQTKVGYAQFVERPTLRGLDQGHRYRAQASGVFRG